MSLDFSSMNGSSLVLPEYRKQQKSLQADVRAWLGGDEGEKSVFGIFDDMHARPKWYERDGTVVATKDEVQERDADGFCYMDSTTLWEQFSDVERRLSYQGEHLSKADLCTVGSDGRSYLEQAARSGAFEEVVQHLARHGETLALEDLLEKNGQPNGVLKAAVAWGQHTALFESKQWKGRTSQEIYQLANALPESAQSEIGGLHTLACGVRQEGFAAMQGRGR